LASANLGSFSTQGRPLAVPGAGAEPTGTMTRRYPDLADIGTLELGAKVAKGEMKWG
jgi:hypothetical protein